MSPNKICSLCGNDRRHYTSSPTRQSAESRPWAEMNRCPECGQLWIAMWVGGEDQAAGEWGNYSRHHHTSALAAATALVFINNVILRSIKPCLRPGVHSDAFGDTFDCETHIFSRSRISTCTFWPKPMVGRMCILSDIRRRSRTSVAL